MSRRGHLIHILGSNTWGGPERYALDICRHYRSQGWKVRIVTRDVRELDSRVAQAGVSLRHAPLRRYPDIFSALILRSMISRIPRGEGIIHVHNHHDALTALMARRLSRRPDIRIVMTRHRGTRGKDSWLRRRIYSSVDRLLFVSEFSRRRFFAAWPDARYPFDLSDTGVSGNSILPSDIVRRPEPEKGPVAAMYRGTLKAGKGLETLIDALSLLKNTKLRLRIVGTGDPDYCDALRRRAQTRGVMERIDWTRRNDEGLDTVADSHFGVFPSIEPEAFGMSNLEFLACGRPQVSTMTGGQREFLDPGKNALEVSPTSAPDLAKAMERLANDPDLRKRMGEEAVKKFEEYFSWPHFIEKIDTDYGLPHETNAQEAFL